MRIERSAGGVVYRKTASGDIEVLIIKDSYDSWAFPKGRVEQNETPVQAARRETLEETDLSDLTLTRPLGRSEFWFTDRFEQPGEKVHKFIDHFLFEAPIDAVARPEGKQRVKEVRWVPLDMLEQTVRYETLQPIVERVLKVLSHGPTIASSGLNQ